MILQIVHKCSFAPKIQSVGRIGIECYPRGWDDKESHPSHEKWVTIERAVLAVGKGLGSPWWAKGCDSNLGESYSDSLIIPVDWFGGAFKTEALDASPLVPHLWFDFNNQTAIAMLPSSWASFIIIDNSTWRYLMPFSRLESWKRILKTGGKLAFEGGISSVKLVTSLDGYSAFGDYHFECDNPTHLVLLVEKASELLGTPIKTSSPLRKRDSNSFPINHRMNLNVTFDPSAHENYVQSLLLQLQLSTLSLLFEAYEELFGNYNMKLELHRDTKYLIETTHPLRFWIQATAQ